ncbi:MAG: hypothetical protein ISS79_09335 [Phycisphaerae bacterium]|nr:hypothetical protein [Phycisphaerae bacterium]
MTETQVRSFRCGEARWQGVQLLADNLGIKPAEIVRCSLPDANMAEFFLQVKHYDEKLNWGRVVWTALNKYLHDIWADRVNEHLNRLGVSMDSTAAEMEEANRKAMEELLSQEETPIAPRLLGRAQMDLVFRGRLLEAVRKAKAGEEGYELSPVSFGVAGMPADELETHYSLRVHGRLLD